MSLSLSFSIDYRSEGNINVLMLSKFNVRTFNMTQPTR
jgi:hypothetical protein